MATLLGWVRSFRQRRREKLADEHASLSEQEKHEVDRLRGEHSGIGTTSTDREFMNRPGT